MKLIYLSLTFTLIAAVTLRAQTVNYAPEYFGPNANPVAMFANATIPAETTLKLAGDYYFGFGDKTGSVTLSAEIPLLPECVSLKVWGNALEYYHVTQEVYDRRSMQSGKLYGSANGDFYIQTRMRILKERENAPAIVLNSALKSASGTDFSERRYFDTPGYYFDLEVGKSIHLNNKIIAEVRGVIDFGFLCWETTNSVQNDAPMYGGKIVLSNQWINLENTLSGYYGWIHNGDAPLVYCAKAIFKRPHMKIFAQYQYGINDFPYHHLQLGVAVSFAVLTSKYEQEEEAAVE